jgi:uncharacterized protein (DUF2384 family)
MAEAILRVMEQECWVLDLDTFRATPYPRTAMATTTRTDADVLRDVRDLFRLTLDEVAGTGISRRTWVRIEQGDAHELSSGVRTRLAQLREFMEIIGQTPYTEARAWAIRPLRTMGGKTPRDLVQTPTGLAYLIARLKSRGELVAT